MASSSSSSDSSSSSGSGDSSKDYSHSDQTIGLAVGLGVGIPILLTVLILAWVTVRHRRKIREEDEMDKDIDFNGDVSLFSPRMPDPVKPGAYTTNTLEGSFPQHGKFRRDTMTSIRTANADAESAVFTEGDAMSTSDFANNSMSNLYTPELGFVQSSQENFSKTIHSVYGPSPAYPSTEKLKAPSFAGSMRSGRLSHQHTGSFSSSVHGPFATPPRSSSSPSHNSGQTFAPAPSFGNLTHPYANHYYRRNSNSSGSIAHDANANSHPDMGSFADNFPYDRYEQNSGPEPPNQLAGLRESPHPYSNLAGAESRGSVFTASSHLADELHDVRDYPDESTSEEPYDAKGPLRGRRHSDQRVYHPHAVREDNASLNS